MKRFGFLLVLCLLLIVGIFYVISNDNREALLLGEWKESEWIYESVKHSKDDTLVNDTISENVKAMLGKSLFIHSAEKWEFQNNKALNIESANHTDDYSWNVKGRGNILVLKNETQQFSETYEIVHISKDSLVLSLDLDLQVQGLAKLVFKKI